jgi:NAD-dependent deacetylase
MLPSEAWSQADDQCNHCDLMIVLGSSLEVTPAAYLPIYALQNKSRLIIINLSPTHLDSQADVCISADVAEVIPEIVKMVLK